MFGGQHTHKPADVGVPDIAVTIDSDAEWPGIVTGKRKDRDAAIAQSPEARAAHHAKPDVIVETYSNAAETSIFLTYFDVGLRDFSPGASAISAMRPPFSATQEFFVSGYLSV